MAALLLAGFVTAWDLWILPNSTASYLVADGTMAHAARRAAGIVMAAAGLAAFFWAARGSGPAIKWTAWAAFTVSTFLEYGFIAGTGAVMNAQDLVMALQSVKYWPAMTRAFVNWSAVIPAIAVAIALWTAPRPPVSNQRRRWALALAGLLLVDASYAAAHLNAVALGVVNPPAPPMPMFQAFFRTVAIAGADRLAAATRPFRREELRFVADGTPRRHVLLVVDESMSASHLSFDGYERHTTPWLERLASDGRISCWHAAAAATVFSNSSFLALMTGFNAFPDVEHRVYTLPTIFQYARAMGYRTHLFDGQLAVRRFGFTDSDMRAIDDWQSAAVFGDDPDTDLRMARGVRRLLQSTEGQFVVVIKRGNHEPHEANYPPGAAAWLPDRHGDAGAATAHSVMVNTYDNAVRYNVDAFFQALLDADGTLPRTAGIYTSDHGEELGGEGRAPLVRQLVPDVVTVPLFLFGSDRPTVDTGYHASHHNIFATLLDLMGVPPSERRYAYGRSLIAARAGDRDARPVLSGYMFGGSDHYEVKDFNDIRDTHTVAAAGAR